MEGKILIADDDKAIRTVLTQALTRAGAQVRATATLSTLYRWIEEGDGDVVLTDVGLPDGNALDSLPSILKRRPELSVIVMSAQNTVMTALKASEVGAFEYLAKPFDLRDMVKVIAKALDRQDTRNNVSGRRNARSTTSAGLPILGRTPIMQNLYRQISRLMNIEQPILITGALGTGKTLFAETLHKRSRHADKPLVTFSCLNNDIAALNTAFAKAKGGTFIVDNLSEAETSLQRHLAELLSLADAQKTRIIATSRRDLGEEVAQGTFRDDLYFAVNVFDIRLPRLTERLDDIAELAAYFLEQAAPEGEEAKALTNDAISQLRKLPWRGNIRELRLLMERLAVMVPEDIIEDKTIANYQSNSSAPFEDTKMNISQRSLGELVDAFLEHYIEAHADSLPEGQFYEHVLHEVERPLLNRVLALYSGNQLKAASFLGINRNTLRKKLSTLDINVTKARKLM